MSDQQDHIIELAAAVARIEAKVDAIDKGVNGNGQPGLAQKVEALEEHKNKVTGAITVIGIIGTGVWGFLEWIFHLRGGSSAPH